MKNYLCLVWLDYQFKPLMFDCDADSFVEALVWVHQRIGSLEQARVERYEIIQR